MSIRFGINSKGGNTISGFIAYIICGLLFFCAGAVTLVYGINNLGKIAVPEGYSSIDGKIDMYGRAYYTVDGIYYEVYNGDAGSMKEDLRDTTVYYNPENPEEAVVFDKSGVTIESVLMMCLGGTVSLAGAYMNIKAAVYNPWINKHNNEENLV